MIRQTLGAHPLVIFFRKIGTSHRYDDTDVGVRTGPTKNEKPAILRSDRQTGSLFDLHQSDPVSMAHENTVAFA
jgi:hypothetical protein